MTLVTLSASYGAGGSRIGPELADKLGVPFVDRAIPVTVAAEQGAVLFQLRAAMGLARRWLDVGRADEIEPLLRPICDLISEDGPDIAGARAMLEGLTLEATEPVQT